MIESIKANNRYWKIYVIFTVLFAVAMSAADAESVFYNIIGVIWLDILVINRKIRVNWSDAVVVLMVLSYDLLSNPDPHYIVIRIFQTFSFCQVVRFLADPCDDRGITVNDDNSINRVAFVILTIAFFMFIRGLLNYSYYLIDDAFLIKKEWPLWDMRWTYFDYNRPENYYGTHAVQQFFFIAMGALLPFFLTQIKKNRILAIAGLVLSATAIWIGTLSAGRVACVCCVIAFMITVIAYIICEKLYGSYLFWIITAGIMDMILAVIILVELKAFGLNNWFRTMIWRSEDSYYYRMRLALMGKAWRYIPQYLFGGFDDLLVIPPEEDIAYYAYNSWLDIASRHGLIPMSTALLVLITGIFAIVYVSRKYGSPVKFMLISVFSSVTIYHMIQPGYYQMRVCWNSEVMFICLTCVLFELKSGRNGLEISFDRISQKLIPRLVGKSNEGKTQEHR